MRGGAGRDIDDGDADARRAVRSAGDRGKSAFGLDQQVVGLAVRVGAVVAIAGDGAADQLGVVLAQAFQREAELVHRTGLEVLDQDVGAGDQVFEIRATFAGGEVDHHGILAAVEPDEIAALSLCRRIVAARKIAFRPLHLDDMGARVGQPRAAERRGDRLFNGDDGQSFKRQHLLFSVRARHAQHVLGEVRQDEIGRNRRHLIEPGLAELALHVIFLGKAKTAMGLHACVRGFPGGIGRQHLGHVGLGAAIDARLHISAWPP